MDVRLTSQDYWLGAGLAAGLSLVIAVPLVLVFHPDDFRRASLTTGIASAIVWGALATFAITRFWDIYYRYIFPQWARRLAAIDIVLYAIIGLCMWWLATRLPGPVVLWFLLLGGVESLAEHLIGIYSLGILEKVPLLQEVAPAPALAFAFFEYIIYWAIVAWLSLAFFKIGVG